MIQITESIPRINFSSLTCVNPSWNVKTNRFSSGIDLVLQSTFYKFIVWASWPKTQSYIGFDPISVLTIISQKGSLDNLLLYMIIKKN